MNIERHKALVLFQLSFGVSPEEQHIRKQRSGHLSPAESVQRDETDHLKRMTRHNVLEAINQSQHAFSFQRSFWERLGFQEDSYAELTTEQFDSAVTALVREGRILVRDECIMLLAK